MDCLAFRARIASGEPLDSAAREHAAQCQACSAVVLDDAAVGRRLLSAVAARSAVSDAASSISDDPAPETSLQAARRLLVRDRGLLGALRARPSWQRLAALLGLLGAGLALMSGHTAHTLREVALHVLTFMAASVLLLWPLGRPLPRLGRALAVGVSLALPLGFALCAHAHAASPSSEISPWPCLALGTLLAASFLALLTALDRRAALGVRQALLAGSMAGIAANAMLHLHCPNDALLHLTVGHAPLAMVAALMALSVELARERRRDAR